MTHATRLEPLTSQPAGRVPADPLCEPLRGGSDEERWKAFFKERKIGNFSDLTESQKTRLALSDNMAQMINS